MARERNIKKCLFIVDVVLKNPAEVISTGIMRRQDKASPSKIKYWRNFFLKSPPQISGKNKYRPLRKTFIDKIDLFISKYGMIVKIVAT
jgi:hypothetical protein